MITTIYLAILLTVIGLIIMLTAVYAYYRSYKKTITENPELKHHEQLNLMLLISMFSMFIIGIIVFMWFLCLKV